MSRLDVTELARLPWGWQGPRRVMEDGATHYELRIRELPDFFLAARTEEELMRELKPALRSYLQTYLDRNEDPPMPERLTWQMIPLPVGPQVTQSAVNPGLVFV
jgi:predicted RNase H-like HicB family nuclease